MEALLEAIRNNPELTAALIVVISDFGAGVIPDRYLPYVGLMRRVIRKIMNKKERKISILVLLLLISVVAGCAHMKPSSVCETEQESLICEKIPQPEHSDILLQLANVRMLKSEMYDAEEALAFLEVCESFLTDEKVSYVELSQWLTKKMDEYKLEVLVLSGYVDMFESPQVISDFDRSLLLGHIEHQKDLIKAYMEEG